MKSINLRSSMHLSDVGCCWDYNIIYLLLHSNDIPNSFVTPWLLQYIHSSESSEAHICICISISEDETASCFSGSSSGPGYSTCVFIECIASIISVIL